MPTLRQWGNSFCCNSDNILSLYLLASCAEKQCADGSTCQVGIFTVFMQLLMSKLGDLYNIVL